MCKISISVAQQIALTKLIQIGMASTSQQIGVQVSTMKSLESAGLVTHTLINKVGRECETMLWRVNTPA